MPISSPPPQGLLLPTEASALAAVLSGNNITAGASVNINVVTSNRSCASGSAGTRISCSNRIRNDQPIHPNGGHRSLTGPLRDTGTIPTTRQCGFKHDTEGNSRLLLLKQCFDVLELIEQVTVQLHRLSDQYIVHRDFVSLLEKIMEFNIPMIFRAFGDSETEKLPKFRVLTMVVLENIRRLHKILDRIALELQGILDKGAEELIPALVLYKILHIVWDCFWSFVGCGLDAYFASARKEIAACKAGLDECLVMAMAIDAGYLDPQRRISLQQVEIHDFFGMSWFLPQDLCFRWEVFHQILRFKFERGPAEQVVAQGFFNVFRQDGLKLINKEAWAQAIEAGGSLQLSVVVAGKPQSHNTSNVLGIKCPRCNYSQGLFCPDGEWANCPQCDSMVNVAQPSVLSDTDEVDELVSPRANDYRSAALEENSVFRIYSVFHTEVKYPTTTTGDGAAFNFSVYTEPATSAEAQNSSPVSTIAPPTKKRKRDPPEEVAHAKRIALGAFQIQAAAHTQSHGSTATDDTSKEPPSCDDKEGHYIIVPDDILHSRYRTVRLLGQGTSGKVVEAADAETNSRVAIKIIRAIPKYRDASKRETRVLQKLKERDPHNENKCIHLLHWFDHRNHICLVSELLGMNLYNFLKENDFMPFPRHHIQAFAKQLLTSVAFLHDLHLIHADLKPEHILLVHNDHRLVPVATKPNAASTMKKILNSTDIRIIDFGSATFESEYHSTVVCTRHYRAPEIILGLGWSYPCDAYSLGCILVEFYTGMALFQTHDNLEHLAMMEMVMGKMPERFARAGARSKPEFFKDDGELDWPQAKSSSQSKEDVRSTRPLSDVIPPYDPINRSFLDFVQRLLAFDPAQRITVKEALQHPYITTTKIPEQDV